MTQPTKPVLQRLSAWAKASRPGAVAIIVLSVLSLTTSRQPAAQVASADRFRTPGVTGAGPGDAAEANDTADTADTADTDWVAVGAPDALLATPAAASSVAREWTEALLYGIRNDFARPPVHARNIHHLAIAMFDAWAMFDARATPVLFGTDRHPACRFAPAWQSRLRASAEARGALAIDADRAIGQAAWRLLEARFADAARPLPIAARFAATARAQGLVERIVDGTGADALGARIAACVIGAGRRDQSNEAAGYANTRYTSVNPALDPRDEGNEAMADAARWQPLAFDAFIDQSGNAASATDFLAAEWGAVVPFALDATTRSTVVRSGSAWPVHHDPGPPPSPHGSERAREAYARQFAQVLVWSSHLDPADGVTIDIAPRARSADIEAFERERDPIAQLAQYPLDGVLDVSAPRYPPNRVLRGDFTRVIAEYWADGPDSETPPGHWLSLYNEHVGAHPALERRLGGDGETLGPLAFDVIAYLALGGALHDAAIAAWSIKAAYDYVRPVSAIRFMANDAARRSPGERAGPPGPNLPLLPGRIERIEAGDPLAGDAQQHVGELKARAWRGPRAIEDPVRDVAGVGWIRVANWWPYQRPSFVTPPFAGYVSGHSTFSRAAAIVLERVTGTPYFPGGLAEFTAPAGDFLVFESGPSADVTLQWATYRDAADQTALSRIWGGIHPPADDLPGRVIGARVGEAAWQLARLHAGREPVESARGPASTDAAAESLDDGDPPDADTLEWRSRRGAGCASAPRASSGRAAQPSSNGGVMLAVLLLVGAAGVRAGRERHLRSRRVVAVRADPETRVARVARAVSSAPRACRSGVPAER